MKYLKVAITYNINMIHEINCFAVGDSGVGKTCLMKDYIFPPSDMPFLSDYEIVNRIYENEYFTIKFWDPEKNDMNTLIQFNCPQIDVFLICFSIDSPLSLENVEKIWVPKVKKYNEHASLILVGCKCDLRKKNSNNDEEKSNETQMISENECLEMKKTIDAQDYIECSAYQITNIEEILKTITKVYLNKKD